MTDQTNAEAAHSLTLWGVGTTRTFRVHWLLHELELPYTTQRIESRTGETTTRKYIELNAKQKIPTLVDVTVDGTVVVSESLAIMRHLRRISDTLPFDEYQQSIAGQAAYDEWASFMLMELDATSLYVVRRHRDLPNIYGEAPAAVTSSIAYYEKMINAVAYRIPASGHLWGSTFSEIDILMAVAIEWGRGVGAQVPTIAEAWHAAMVDRDAYRIARKHNYSNLQLKMATTPTRPT